MGFTPVYIKVHESTLKPQNSAAKSANPEFPGIQIIKLFEGLVQVL
jgi:hypothetical protein